MEGSILDKDLGARLHAARRTRGLSRDRLAALAGVGRVTIWYLECGRTRSPQVKTIALLANALSVPLTALLGEGARRRKGV